jgi:hypothetical protein
VELFGQPTAPPIQNLGIIGRYGMGRRSGSASEIRNRLADKRRDFPQILSTEYKHCHSEHDKQFLHANLPHGIDCSVPDLQGFR